MSWGGGVQFSITAFHARFCYATCRAGTQRGMCDWRPEGPLQRLTVRQFVRVTLGKCTMDSLVNQDFAASLALICQFHESYISADKQPCFAATPQHQLSIGYRGGISATVGACVGWINNWMAWLIASCTLAAAIFYSTSFCLVHHVYDR